MIEPVGALIVKTVENGAPQQWDLFAMAKRGGNYNADGATNWEFFTLLINAGNGPPIRDGVDRATRPASRTFPYLAAPNPDPPQPPSHL